MHQLDDCEISELRIAAAELANQTLRAAGMGATPELATQWRDYWFAYLTSPQTVALSLFLTITNAHGRVLAQMTTDGGNPMASSAFTMDDTLTVSAQPEDDHGDPTSDSLSWSSTDGGTVVTLAVSADTHSVTLTPVAEGAGTLSVTDSAAAGVTGSLDFTVSAGATSQIVLTPTVNTGANAVPPAG